VKHLAFMLALLAATPAHAGGVVAVVDGHVAQYNEALAAAKEVLKGPPVIDTNAKDAAEQLKRADPSVVLAIGKDSLQVAKAALPSTPIVFCMVLGPMAASSRNVTGIKLEVSPTSQLERWRQVSPATKRIGVIYDPRVSGQFVEEAVKASGRLGVTLVAKPVYDIKEVREAVAEIADAIDGLWLMSDPRLMNIELFQYLLVFTLERKIALFGFLESLTKFGALASMSPDYPEIGRAAARMVEGLNARPPESRLPVPPLQPSPGALTVNTKTARQLGLDVPNDVLAKARQVYR
jgi:putative ABC transport system substrate-binding protein